jgi:heme/copper-type cytochrome/quinol oxidase subunit 4
MNIVSDDKFSKKIGNKSSADNTFVQIFFLLALFLHLSTRPGRLSPVDDNN